MKRAKASKNITPDTMSGFDEGRNMPESLPDCGYKEALVHKVCSHAIATTNGMVTDIPPGGMLSPVEQTARSPCIEHRFLSDSPRGYGKNLAMGFPYQRAG